MAVYSIEKLSASVDGKGVKVAGVAAGAATAVHVAAAGAADIDLVTLWAVNQNNAGAPRTLTLCHGGVADPDNQLTIPLPARQGPIPLTDRFPLMNGLTLSAFADVANEVVIYGRVERVDKP